MKKRLVSLTIMATLLFGGVALTAQRTQDVQAIEQEVFDSSESPVFYYVLEKDYVLDNGKVLTGYVTNQEFIFIEEKVYNSEDYADYSFDEVMKVTLDSLKSDMKRFTEIRDTASQEEVNRLEAELILSMAIYNSHQFNKELYGFPENFLFSEMSEESEYFNISDELFNQRLDKLKEVYRSNVIEFTSFLGKTEEDKMQRLKELESYGHEELFGNYYTDRIYKLLDSKDIVRTEDVV